VTGRLTDSATTGVDEPGITRSALGQFVSPPLGDRRSGVRKRAHRVGLGRGTPRSPGAPDGATTPSYAVRMAERRSRVSSR
jgi:hypothetical protein